MSKIYLDGFVIAINMSQKDVQRLTDPDDPGDKFRQKLDAIDDIREFGGPYINGMWHIVVQRNEEERSVFIDKEAEILENEIRSAWQESFKEKDLDD